ncbi:hypothetical protein EBZ39_11905 [bacterium]|nr:hypothetical protein [bacterium]
MEAEAAAEIRMWLRMEQTDQILYLELFQLELAAAEVVAQTDQEWLVGVAAEAVVLVQVMQ